MQDALSIARGRLREDGPLKYRYDNADDAPVPHVRQALTEHMDSLAHFLEPAPRILIEAEITSLFGVMAVKDVEQVDRSAEMRIWREDFLRAGLCRYGLTEACSRFRSGDAGDSKGKFKPTPGEVIQEARRIERDYRKEHRDVYAVLTADVPEERGARDPAVAKAAVAEWNNVIKPAMLAASDMRRASSGRKPYPPLPQGLPERAVAPALSDAALKTYTARAPSDAVREHVEEHGA